MVQVGRVSLNKHLCFFGLMQWPLVRLYERGSRRDV